MEQTPLSAADPYELRRFIVAQEHTFARALDEIRRGEKQSHWMWFIFPALEIAERSALQVFGSPDDRKLQSSATLFASIAHAGSVFDQLLDKFFGGERDGRTLELLEKTSD